MTARRLRPVLVALPLLLAACGKPEIASYRVPKEKDPEPKVAAAMPPAASGGAGNNMAATPVATAQGNGLVWTAPPHWQAKPASAMRKGSYTIAGPAGEADMSITAFPNNVGGELANVNRWRGELQLPPITAAELPNVVVRHDHNGMIFGEVDLVGTGAQPRRTLAAWVAFQGDTWFFKLLGPDATVAKEKAAFSAFIDSIKPAAR